MSSKKKNREAYLAEVSSYSANNYKPIPVVLARGKGVWVWDTEGKKYLDCLSAYSAMNHGHRHPKIIAALKKQADLLTLSSRAFHNDRMGGFLAKLCRLSGFERALPMNTGAEAVESALKLVRKWGYQKKGIFENQAEIIVCSNNFHGRTVTIVSFSTEEQYRRGFGPFTPGFKIIDYGDAQQLERAITPRTAGFMLEPIQGEGGVIVPPEGYLSAVREICSKAGILLIMDEIQTGLGRTGKLFCYQHENAAKPDVLVLGKALGGGAYPVSAVLASEDVMSVFTPGDHGSTFGGNPLGSAVGIAALDVLTSSKLPEKALRLGDYLQKKLRALGSPHVEEIRGKGLMVGIQIKRRSGKAREFCERLADRGVLVKDTHEQVIRLTPPLVITRQEIDWMVKRISEILQGTS